MPSENALKIIDLEVSRAKSNPLTLEVTADGPSSNIGAAVRLAQKYMDKCQHLRVYMAVQSMAIDPLDVFCPPSDLSLLRSIVFTSEVDSVDGNTDEDIPRVLLILPRNVNLSKATSLQSLNLSLDGSDRDLVLPPSQATNLQRMIITGPFRIAPALRSCIQLETLDWTSEDFRSLDQYKTRIDLPKLRNMRLQGSHCIFRAAKIEAAELIQLSIEIHDFDVTCMNDFGLRPHFPNLQRISYFARSKSARQWENALALLYTHSATLEEIAFDFWSDFMVEAFGDSSSPMFIASKIKRFIVASPFYTTADIDGMQDLLQFRMDANSTGRTPAEPNDTMAPRSLLKANACDDFTLEIHSFPTWSPNTASDDSIARIFQLQKDFGRAVVMIKHDSSMGALSFDGL